MGIVIGDIVERKKRTGHLYFDGNIAASSMFYEGYFVVVDIQSTVLINPISEKRKEVICKIMNSSGEMSWISMEYLFKI
mgnify:FL=1